MCVSGTAGGWSFHYDTSPTFVGSGLPSSLPGAGTGGLTGSASVYPITFDLSDVPAGVRVRDVNLRVTLTHAFPDDIRLMLEAPNGGKVQVMSNAGTTLDITNVSLTFDDSAANSLPDAAQIVAGTFKPTRYGTDANFPAPAPAMPYATTLASLDGQEARGIWKLWAWDDAATDTGTVVSASLTIDTEQPPDFSFQVPTSGPTYLANTPFLHVEGNIAHLADSPHSATWRTMVGGQYYASGPMTFVPGTNTVKADVPMKKGTNFVQVFVYNTAGSIMAQDGIDTTVNEFVYTLSEGATGTFFDLDVTLANPTGAAAPVSIEFLPEHSSPVPHANNVAATGLLQLAVDNLTPADAVSTVVHSTNAIPLAVERTMSWDQNGYGGSGGTAISPNKRWLFAEGSQGFFDTFILLANDSAGDANVTVKFLIEGVPDPVSDSFVLPAHSRKTMYAGNVPQVVNTSFGLDITSDVPITAERSMYFPHSGGRTFEGGHEAAGTNATSTKWYLAEGATGPYFQCYVLLSNPTASIAHVTLSYLLPDGTTIPQTVDVPPNGRKTIDLETVAPQLANTPVSTIVTSDVGIIAERSMYWPDISLGWQEAHNSIGVTEPALRWAVADGRIGGPRGYQTYILLANPNNVPAEVRVWFLQNGVPPLLRNYTLQPTSRTNIPAGEIPEIGVGVPFSADVQVVNYQPIIVEKALYWNSGAQVWAAGTGTVGTPIPPPE